MNNQYGLDDNYFRKELQRLADSAENRTPEEMHRYLLNLAKIVEPRNLPQANVKPLLSDVLAELDNKTFSMDSGHLHVARVKDMKEILSKYFT